MSKVKISELPASQAIKAATGAITITTGLTTTDNIVINGNTISASVGAVNIIPEAGSAIVLDGTINIDAGVVTGATSIASTAFAGALTGNVTGNVSGTAATVTTAAQPAITSLGTLTALQVDNLNVNGNTISATTGAINITPEAGSAIVLDGAINIDAGVVTGATSISSTSFVGALTGNASTVTTNANLTGVITSSGNATSIASQTGTGTKFVVDTSPTLVTPDIGVATATSVNKLAITAPGTSATLTIANGKTLTCSNILTFTGTDSSSVAFGAGGTVAYIGTAQTFTKAQVVGAVSLTSTSNSVATDASLSTNFTHTMTESTTLANPTNLVAGQYIQWTITQDSTPRTLAFGNLFKWVGGSALVVSTGSGAIDTINAYYNGTVLLTNFAQAYA